MNLDHLASRCGTCRWWESWQMGIGHCELSRQPGAPIRATDMGSVETRIDFGCIAHEPLPTEAPS